MFKQYIAYSSGSALEKWVDVIETFPTQVMEKVNWSHSEKYDFSEYCEQRTYAVVGKYFDVLSWWKEYEKMFPYVFPSTIFWPAMNAFQERVFSISSWFDSNCLMCCQTSKTLEMCVLECITRKSHKDIIESEKHISQARQDMDDDVIEVMEGNPNEECPLKLKGVKIIRNVTATSPVLVGLRNHYLINTFNHK